MPLFVSTLLRRHRSDLILNLHDLLFGVLDFNKLIVDLSLVGLLLLLPLNYLLFELSCVMFDLRLFDQLGMDDPIELLLHILFKELKLLLDLFVNLFGRNTACFFLDILGCLDFSLS